MSILHPTLKNKFFLQLIIILVIMIGLNTVILKSLHEVQTILTDTSDQREELVEVQEILTRHLSVHDALSTYLTSGDEAQAIRYQETMEFFVRPKGQEYFSKISQIYHNMNKLHTLGLALITQKKNQSESTPLTLPLEYTSLVEEVDVLINRSLDEKFDTFNKNTNLLQDIFSKVTPIVTQVIIAAGIIILISSASIVFPVIRRLQEFTKHVLRHHDDTEWTPLKTTSQDEVGILTRAYNEMSRKLYSKTRDLKSLNETLNQKVVARTNSLAEQKEIVTEQAERLNTILESIGEGIIVLDEENRIVRMNHAALSIFGAKKETLLNKNLFEDCGMYHGENTKLDLESLLGSEKMAVLPQGTVVKVSHTDEVALAGVITRITVDEIPAGSVIVLRDETERRNLDKLRSEFASVVSHQMRTPLSVIRWISEEIITNKKKDYTKKQLTKINTIYENNYKLIELVNNFIQLSKLDNGNLEIVQKETEMLPFLQAVIKELEILRKKNNAKITLDIPENLTLSLDESRIKEVFYNLIHNALKYSPEKGVVEVSLLKKTKKTGMLTFAIKDNGIGIPEEAQENIFEKFYRADNAREKVDDGNGLGLYIVKAIIELHGGTISFTSNKNGTIFYVMLPKDLVTSA